ncbi:GNAT family N-acetyltransferase [Pseudonocardia halophobica]|uniref:GNAT family N-acetyltransferase n=1 Tax=Pseudonocardia halophobica TaxID=29401 RepID=UPI003D9479DD
MRSPRLADAAEWRRLRILNRERIEPWWVSSSLSWEERHSDAEWMSHYLHARRAAIAGKALPLVVEVDGRFTGQCNLEWIDPHNGNAELGIWLDEAIAATGLTGVAAAAVVDYAFGPLGLHRLSAPIADGNDLAAWGAERLGMRREGLMAGYLDVGGRRRAHHLWAITRDDLPEGGMLAFATTEASRARGPRRDARPASG